jgi:hypothetical protein
MAGKVLRLEGIVVPDNIAQSISNNYISWSMARNEVINAWAETRAYIYATDTTKTTNSKLPWKNKTTTPKLTQIRENLYANYYATMFGNRNWIAWEAADESSDKLEKRKMIEDYMYWVVDQPEFYKEIQKLLLDYIDTGNPFVSAGWLDQTIEEKEGKIKRGYRGPVPVRISPLDIVFNPIAPSFDSSPKIVKSIITLGELKDMVERPGAFPESDIDAKQVFDYLRQYRQHAQSAIAGAGDLSEKDRYLMVDGFTSYRHYLESDFVEVLTFYGDAYDRDSDKLYKNHIITVVDRHKIISNRPNPAMFGKSGIHHCGWRPRQDNLWAQGPLDNLVGMQYRIDHIENLKADCFDLMAFPPVEVKGYVSDFTWQPMEKIYVGDEGSVKPFPPDVRILQANTEIADLMAKMEEMAGAPKEAMGFRNPGEKTKYEVQRLENAYSRIFHSKVAQFEQFMLEPLLNDMLALAVQNMTSSTVPSFDPEYGVTSFADITAEDLAGVGRIRAIGARHFAQEAEVVQNLNQMFNSPLGADPAVMQHWSTIALSQMLERMFKIEKYKIVKPYVRLAEMADSQKRANSLTEQVQMEAGTPSGVFPDDVG